MEVAMTRIARRFALLCPAGVAPPPEPARASETPGLLATQVTIAVDRGGSRRQFRATVMAIEGETLTLLTAAHCLSAADEGGPALLLLGEGEVVEGSVLAVVRNPSYRDVPAPGPAPGPGAEPGRTPKGPAAAPRRRAAPPRELPGPDNALAKIRCKPANPPAEAAFRAIRPAPALTARTYPPPDGQTVAVRLIDGHGVEHSVRAGNHGNPRWLEWGPGYKPIPGDSGGGVFAIHTGADGQARPILIGIIVGNDDRGGGASLVAREYPWIARELPRLAADR